MSMLSEKVKLFPDSPGVYRFLDPQGEILYIGRATSLRKRVSNYFTNRIDARIREMVSLAKDIKYEQTDTVLEAIILEANLIKKYWPKYNVRDKDNRSFLYIVIPKTDYPKPLIVRHRELEKFSSIKAHVFGPYQSVTLLKNALKIIRRIFPYSTCSIGSEKSFGEAQGKPFGRAQGKPFGEAQDKPFGEAQGKPCFDYQIGLCPGACIGAISKADYQKNIKNIILLLSGKRELLLKRLSLAHPEKAAALRHIQDVSLITRDELVKSDSVVSRIEGYDISHLSGKETYGSMAVFIDGEPDTSLYRIFSIKDVAASDDLHALEEMLVRRLRHTEWDMPDIIMIDGGKPQIDHIAGVFKKLNVTIPFVGISKYGGDALVFPIGTKSSMRELTQGLRLTLLQVRDEAHRFARKASRHKRAKGIPGAHRNK